MKTKIEILQIYLEIVDLARSMNCRIVRDDYFKMADDLCHQIYDELMMDGIIT